MIIPPELIPIVGVVLIGIGLVLSIGISGIAILVVGPRRPSALVMPAIAAFAELVLVFWIGNVLSIRITTVPPVIGAVIAAFVAARLQRRRLTATDDRP
jgi:arginine exporter protein ArgO